MFRSDIRWRILVALSKNSPTTLRGLARLVGITPKALYKYIEELRAAQIIEVQPIRGSKITLIKLTPDGERIREMLRRLPLPAIIVVTVGLAYGYYMLELVKAVV